MTVTASNYERRKNDLYETEEWATEALLRHLNVTGLTVWEPAAGNHKIADVLNKRYARRVLTSDIMTYDREHSGIYDFLSSDVPPFPAKCDAIITNPPYGRGNRDAVHFARKALKRSGWVALLLTAKFDHGKTRVDLFRDNPRFWGKIALLDRLSFTDDGATGTEDHAWFIWGPHEHWPKMMWEGK